MEFFQSIFYGVYTTNPYDREAMITLLCQKAYHLGRALSQRFATETSCLYFFRRSQSIPTYSRIGRNYPCYGSLFYDIYNIQ